MERDVLGSTSHYVQAMECVIEAAQSTPYDLESHMSLPMQPEFRLLHGRGHAMYGEPLKVPDTIEELVDVSEKLNGK